MERIEFEDIYDLAEIMDSYVTSNVSEHEYPIISAYVDYKLAKSLVEILISMGNSIGAILELEDYEMSHYDKEYCIYLTEDGITCEKTFNDGSYYNGGGDISYVHEDCNSKSTLLTVMQSSLSNSSIAYSTSSLFVINATFLSV